MLSNYIPVEILEKMIFGSNVEQHITATIYFVVGIIALGILQKVILKKLEILSKKTKNDIDDVIIEIVRGVRPKFYIILSFYIAVQVLTLNVILAKIISAVFIFVVIFQITSALRLLVNFLAHKFSGDEEGSEHTKSAAYLLGTMITFVIWVMGILMILSNIGVDVTSLIAGIGIGGVAIAFALKEILADLFASFSIYFDRPFKAGDSITLNDEHKGTVEKIGIKTTRLRASSGEEIVVSNQDLTSSRLHNFKKMERRRGKFLVKVVRSTPVEKLKMIEEITKEIIESVDNLEFSRCHFTAIEDWSHTFQVAYYVGSRSYAEYLDAQQEINFKLCEKLREAEIELAYPTQTTFEFETNVN